MNAEPRSRTPVLLWLALAAVLLSSWSHTARAFGGLEPGGPAAWLTRLSPAVGPLAALAVDLGAGALAWAVGARARQGRGAADLWAGVVAFAALGAFANVDAALAVLGAGHQPGAVWAGLAAYDRLRVGALAAALPMLSVYLARVIETAAHDAHDDAPTGAHVQGDAPARPRVATLPTVAHVAPAAPARPRAHLPAAEPPTVAAERRPSGANASAQPAAVRATAAPAVLPTARPRGRRKAGPADLEAAALEAPDASLADLARMLRTPRQTVSRWAASLDDEGRLTRGAGGRWQAGEGGASD
ncbi:MAG: hypothetical protein IPJ58_12195 [Ardenticatenia bacterium]|nr:hypothetical protein [Ardenticatenia bacterium]